jgi:hypothetical protein
VLLALANGKNGEKEGFNAQDGSGALRQAVRGVNCDEPRLQTATRRQSVQDEPAALFNMAWAGAER